MKTALIALALACAAATAGSTVSAWSSAATNPESTFATRASFFTCPGTTITGSYVTGLEMGRRAYSADGLFPQGAAVTVDGAVARTGGYSLKIAPAGASNHVYSWYVPSQPTSVVRFALRMDTLPGNVQQLASMSAGGGATMHLRFVGSSKRLAVAVTGATGGTPVVSTASTPLTAGAWHVVEIRYAVGTTTHAVDWQVDEVAQPGATVAGTATAVSQNYLGTQVADTYTAYYDDIVITGAGSLYPLGDGRVRALRPNGMGTHSNAAHFQDDDATAIDALSWQRLDEVPTSSTADYIQQVTANAASYAEITFDNTTETCIRAVHGYVALHSAATNQSNVAKVSAFDGATESILKNGSFTANTTVSRDYGKPVTPAGGGWTQSSVNGLVARFGYSSDASPVPILDAVLLEYEVPQ